MGVEQDGSYFEYGGGSGDYGGGADFILDMGGGGAGDFTIDPGFGLDDSGGPIDWGFDTTSWPTLGDIGAGADFNYGYGAGTGEPVADSINWDSFGYMDMGNGYLYDPSTGGVLDTGLYQPTSGSDLYGAYLDYYMDQGYDFYEASAMASDQAAQGSVLTETLEKGAPPVLPDLPIYYPLPYVDNWDPYQTPPYIPTFPDLPPPPPPAPPPAPAKLGPCNTTNGLPGYCAAGTYHPANDPCSCVPFPQATTNAPKPPTGTAPAPAPAPKPPAPAPKPPAQQSCPPGQQRNPATGQCQTPMPAPRCPTGYTYNPTYQRCLAPTGQTACPTGYVWDARISRCVAQPGMPNVLPGPGDFIQPGLDLTLGDLANLPWWLWAALAGVLFFSMSGDERKTTTVRYRRG